MLRQPCFQTAGSFSQRLRFPVSSTSSASAKLDLPLPLRPTTRVSPGRGVTSKVAGRPDPAESADRQRLQVSAGWRRRSRDIRGLRARLRLAAQLGRQALIAFQSGQQDIRRLLRKRNSAKRRRTIPSSTSSIPMLYHGFRPAAKPREFSPNSLVYTKWADSKCTHRGNSNKRDRQLKVLLRRLRGYGLRCRRVLW